MKNIIFCFLIFSLSGCSTIVVPESSGGSRSDGIVEMSFEYGLFEKPQVKWSDAQAEAASRCIAWGYKDAKRFGAFTEECEVYDKNYCTLTLVKIKYQCVG